MRLIATIIVAACSRSCSAVLFFILFYLFKTPWQTALNATYTHMHPFSGLLPGTTRVDRYQKGKTNLDFTEARDNERQLHQLGLRLAANR